MGKYVPMQKAGGSGEHGAGWDGLPTSLETTATNSVDIVYQGTVDGTYAPANWSRKINGGASQNAIAGSKIGDTVSPIWITAAANGDTIEVSYSPGDLSVGGESASAFTDLIVTNNIP